MDKYKIICIVEDKYLDDLYKILLEAKKYYKFELSPAYTLYEKASDNKKRGYILRGAEKAREKETSLAV